MGSLLAIPRSVNVDDLGLTPVGAMIAHALQTYGAYVSDTAGAWTLYAQMEAESRISSARYDMWKLRPLVRCVTNNGPRSIGGRGARLAPPAPPFAD